MSSREAVIEECARVCDALAEEHRKRGVHFHLLDAAKRISALASPEKAGSTETVLVDPEQFKRLRKEFYPSAALDAAIRAGCMAHESTDNCTYPCDRCNEFCGDFPKGIKAAIRAFLDAVENTPPGLSYEARQTLQAALESK